MTEQTLTEKIPLHNFHYIALAATSLVYLLTVLGDGARSS